MPMVDCVPCSLLLHEVGEMILLPSGLICFICTLLRAGAPCGFLPCVVSSPRSIHFTWLLIISVNLCILQLAILQLLENILSKLF